MQIQTPQNETARLLAGTDWERTALGPSRHWPACLRTAVALCMNSRFPMFVWWGEGLVNIYNDAYIPVLGNRHPWAFGAPAREVWREIWPVIGPQVDEVMLHGRATWSERSLLVMERNDFTEQAYFTWSYSPIHDEDGRVGGLFCACTEETARVKAERERDALLRRLQSNAATLQGWFDHAPGFIALLRGPDFVFEMVNKAYHQLVGQRAVQGRPAFEALPELREQGYEELLRRVYTTGEPFIGRGLRIMVQREPGAAPAETYIDLAYQPLLGSDGRVSGIFAQGQDVTEQVMAVRALQEADRRKDDFLATLAHELRNPLAPIRQAAALSKMANADAGQKAWALDVIERQTHHMALLLDDLLDVSRISMGKLELRIEPVDLHTVLQSAIETARPALDQRQHALHLDVPSEAVMLQADALRLAQVLSNLLSNAAKYTPAQGHICLGASVHGREVHLAVSDNGIGLAPESRHEIFRMFSQVSTALDRAEGGLGIGLSLSRGLVELHGGSIEVESEGLGCGACFTVKLPLPAQPPGEPVARAAASVSGEGRLRILLADDNVDALESLQMLLEFEGHEVWGAADGQQAIQLALAHRPDVAVIDIGMPLKNGYEVARELRSHAWAEGLTLIALTGWGQSDDQRRAHEAGFDHHCTKPIDPDRLRPLLGTRQAGAR